MKKRKTKHSKLWVIGAMAIFLLAAPCTWAIEYDVTEDVDHVNIWPDTTVNLDNNANVLTYVYVFPRGTLNIYSGNVGWWIGLLGDGLQYQTVTVYGTDFAVDGVPVATGADQFTPIGSAVLTGTYGNDAPIDLLFKSDSIPIYLQPPASDDEEKGKGKGKGRIKSNSKGKDKDGININLKSRGVVPVAVLSTANINPAKTVTFARAASVRSTLIKNNGMLFHFKTEDMTELNENSTEATLKGETFGGDSIELTYKVRIVPQKKK